MNPITDLACRILRLWAPPVTQTVSQWADENFYLSPEYAAEPGKWKTLAYQREPMDSVSDPRVRRTVIRSATQMLKSVVIQTGVGYFAHRDPGPMLLLQPGDQDAKDFSKERIAPMIRDTPVLRSLFSESKRADSDSTISEKLFPGGMLAICGAGSARNVARRTIRILFCDETDKYRATQEGNSIALARKRLVWFRHRAKEVDTCSPTVVNSEIDRAYEASDQCEYYVPCPACGHQQSLMQKFYLQVRWNSDLPTREEQAHSAHYHCEACDAGWDDAARWSAVDKGEWRAHKPFTGVAGFWISELYSYQRELWEIVLDFLTKKDNSEELRGFVNTSLAENWTEKGEAPEWATLVARANEYPAGTVPRLALFLTAGADVQRDRIEVEIVGWGRGRESWSVDYRILEGRTSEPEVWRKLDELLEETFPHESGARLPISRLFIDSGDGTTTNDVYTWARSKDPGRVTAIKGDDRGALPVSQPSHVDVKVDGKKDPNGIKIKTVKVTFFKGELYAALKLRAPTQEEREEKHLGYPPLYCHFPTGRNFGDEHFKQLTAEELVSRKNRRTGRIVLEYVLQRPRNEALDCRIYARAAAWDFGLDQAQEEHWKALEEQLIPVTHTPAPPPPPAAKADEYDGWKDPDRSSRYIDRKNWFNRR